MGPYQYRYSPPEFSTFGGSQELKDSFSLILHRSYLVLQAEKCQQLARQAGKDMQKMIPSKQPSPFLTQHPLQGSIQGTEGWIFP